MIDQIKFRNNICTHVHYIAIPHEPLARQGFRGAEANIREVRVEKQI